MADGANPSKIECYDVPEDRPGAAPNPFKIGEFVCLRDGTATNGTVSRTLGNQVLVSWDGAPGEPQWYHQDFVATEKSPVERARAPIQEDKPTAIPNPFKIGDPVRLRDGTFTNGTVRRILVDQVLVAWDNAPGDPQWYNQDFILPEKKPAGRGNASQENRLEQDIVDKACGLVARMDDHQRRRFITYIVETYK